MKRIAIISEGGRAVVRAVASRALKEFLDELKGENDEAVVWGGLVP